MEKAPLKDRFTSLDTLAVVRELRALGRARVDKAFDDPAREGFLLALRAPGLGRRELRMVPGRYATLMERAEEHPEELSPFARELRRLLSGAVLQSVGEPGGERVLQLELRRGDVPEPLLLVVELFGAGNIVVVRGSTVVAVLHPRSWAHRTLRIGAEFRPPPARGNPWTFGAAELTQALLSSRTDRVSTLAARLAFGGPVAEELLARAGLAPTEPAAEAPARAAEAIVAEVQGLLAEVGERPAGYLYSIEEVWLDVEPYPARRFPESEVKRAETVTFSEAADRFFSEVRPVTAPPTAEELRRRELERQREQQRETIGRLEAEVAALRAQADAILAHYPEAEAALAAAPPPASGSGAPVELTLGDVPVHLRRGQDPRVSAQAFYEEMKRSQLKLKGARSALEDSERSLERPRARATPAPRAETGRRKRFWFEPYRWFLSSEGVLVLAGRDAASNDRIVKRYLGERDRYVHADLHGAASVVVKHPVAGAPEMTEQTLREAGQFGLAFSKAWRAGRGSGDAFWVEAEQVSKSAGSGEFVPRGAWAIHGTKHALRDLPLELGVGVYEYEGERVWSVAPPEALRARGELRSILRPGEERERGETEVTLARELGLSRSELQPLLPAGGIAARRA
jgi:predicted ribosome quality control (RQC) complex YloA/Tae2 family protein